MERFAQKLTTGTTIELLARLIAVYGPPWGRDDQNTSELMALEWHRAMAHLPEECVVAAVERYIGSPATRWPVPGQIIEGAKADTDHMRRVVYANHRYIAPAEIVREPTPDERARVKTVTDGWKKQFGDSKSQVIGNRMEDWAPASKATTISGALKQSCAARRARGEQTCASDCQRQMTSSNCQFSDERMGMAQTEAA